MATSSFDAFDYVIFGAIFVISSTVGAVFGYKDRKNQSTENYYFGGKKISPVPVAISISVSYVSAVTLIGMPSEIYLYGSAFAWYIFAVTFASFVGFVYYVPVFHRLHLNSLYEYLELRFCKRLRQLASAIGIVYLGLFTPIAIYVPSLALSAVTPLSLNWTIVLISMTCTFYTTLGGMKAVIWTDVLQSIIMLVGIISVLVQGSIAVGGFNSVISAAERGRRNNFLTFDVDPRTRTTFWTMFVGYAVISHFDIICNQVIIQRWLSCKNIKQSRIAIALSLVFVVILTTISLANGLIMFAYYEDCDPLQSGKIDKLDQMLPLLAKIISKYAWNGGTLCCCRFQWSSQYNFFGDKFNVSININGFYYAKVSQNQVFETSRNKQNIDGFVWIVRNEFGLRHVTVVIKRYGNNGLRDWLCRRSHSWCFYNGYSDAVDKQQGSHNWLNCWIRMYDMGRSFSNHILHNIG